MNKHEIEYINLKLIELNNFVFSDPLLPYGAIREANTHCTHLQIAQADTQTQICKRVQFYPSLTELYRKGIHGIEHTYRVLLLVQELSELENLSQDQKSILEFCAIFHDIGRINDDIDDFHGIRSIKKLISLDYLGLNYFDNSIVKYIIENHCISDKIAFDKIINYDVRNDKEAIYLLKLFKDADNLDRFRINDFNPKYIRLKSSLQLIEYSKQLVVKHNINTCLAEY